jgi:hypothetical protein
MLARDRGPSSLRHMVNASDRDSTPAGSDAESTVSQASVASNRPQRRPRTDATTCTEYLRLARGSCQTTKSPRQWTQTDLKHRLELDPLWADFINSRCHRAFLLDHFREQLVDPSTKRDPAPSSLCCSGCNPSLHVMPVVERFSSRWDRVAQKSTAGAGDIGNQVQVGMATPVGDVLTASSSTRHISVSVPSVVPTTPPRNSGSIFGSPPMLSSVSALPRAAELAHLNRRPRPRLSSTGEAMPPPADEILVSQVPSSSAGPKSFVRMPVGSTTPESVFNMASLLDSPSVVTDVGTISDHVVDDSPSRTAARSNNRRKETLAEDCSRGPKQQLMIVPLLQRESDPAHL